MKKRHPASLKTYLLLVFSVAAILPHVVLGIAGLGSIASLTRRSSDEKIRIIVRSIEEAANSFLADSKTDLEQAGRVLDLGMVREDDLSRYLDTFLASYPAFEAVLLLDSRGFVRALGPSSADYLGLDMSRQDFFRTGQDDRGWSSTFLSLRTGKPTVSITLPLSKGVLVGTLNIDGLNNLISHMALGSEGSASIVDSHGTYLANIDPRLAKERVPFPALDFIKRAPSDNPSFDEYSDNTETYVAAAVRIPETGWVAMVSQPLRAARAPVLAALGAFVASFALSAALVIAFVASSRKRILAPLGRLTERAGKIMEGNYAFEPPAASGLAETDGLSEAFSAMSRAIASREKDMVEAEERLKASLGEKEMLLREIHHRVKNNLQVISSIMNLQAAAMEDEAMAAPFLECQNRVQAMASAHESLYRSLDIAHVPVRGYLESLAANIVDTHHGAGERIRIDVEAMDADIDMDSAVPCGLIVTECVTNAFKHAFPGGREGKILISFGMGADSRCWLSVSDDGIGLPGDFDGAKSDSLGLQLVDALARQLGGRHSLIANAGGGLEVRVDFDRAKAGIVARKKTAGPPGE